MGLVAQCTAPPRLTLLRSFQIPVTQACLMEDIEQWLSTDVVSRGSPSQGAKAQAHSPDGSHFSHLEVAGHGGRIDSQWVTRGALLWDTSAAGSDPSPAGCPPLLGTSPPRAICQCGVPAGVRPLQSPAGPPSICHPPLWAPRTKCLGTSSPRGCLLQATKTMFLPKGRQGSISFCLVVAEAYPLPSPQLECAWPQSLGVSLSTTGESVRPSGQ